MGGTGDNRGFLGGPVSWLLSLAAIAVAIWLSHEPVMVRIGYVISDQITRGLGIIPSHRVLLVRLDQTLPKPQFEQLLAKAIPSLLGDYHAEIVAVDLDFYSGQEKYSQLAASLAATTGIQNDSVIWAVSYQRPAQTIAVTPQQKSANAYCEDCTSAECVGRFTPQPVFGSNDPQNFGLAIGLPDEDGIIRWSPRFVCQVDTRAPLSTFHFRIVEAYCARHQADLVTCRDLQPNRQARSRIYSWYQHESIDLCRLVNCHGQNPGDPSAIPDTIKKDFKSKIANNIVILYWDEPGSDEHMTMMSTEKGAAIVASLIENELQFGAQPHFKVLLLKYLMEAAITMLLLFLFHYKYTESWAILIASGFFVLYLRFTPQLSSWVPDFRDYVFVLILGFWVEVLLKAAFHSISSAIRSRKTAWPVQPPTAPGPLEHLNP
jgi:hypothetical protein